MADIIEKITHVTFLIGLIFLFNTAKRVATNNNAKPAKKKITFRVEPPAVTVFIIKMTKSRLVKNKINADSKGENASKYDLLIARK